jgi:hypothetical protein
VPETEPTQVELVGQVIDNSHGGSPFTGDWLAVIAIACWPVTITLAVLAFLICLLIDALRGKSRKQAAEAPTVEHTINPHAQRAARYEAEGNWSMAEHTRRMYHLPQRHRDPARFT